MAHAALVSLAQTIDLILNYHQGSISPQVKNQMISIHEYIIFLQVFLEDFQDKANSLEAIIREVTRAAEDVIEFLMSEHIYESRHTSLESSDGPSKSKFKQQAKGKYQRFRYGFHQLKEVTEEIEFIAERAMKIRNSVAAKDVRVGDSTAASSSSRVAPIHKDAMVGFQDELTTIKDRLFRESSNLEVVPIVGMGGIGKTTLARNVYEDKSTMERFDIRLWATISQDYNVQEIVSGLLVSMKVFNSKKESMEEHHVYQNLKRRRYLIVLDDIWSIEAWDDLKRMFPDDDKGSRIMLTTRLSDVASYADTRGALYEVRAMDDHESWNLLRQKVFKEEPCPPELESVGRLLSRSCKGLPLAIVVISGLLKTVDRTEAAWWNIAENVHDEQSDKILSLSYTHLPYHLRPFFLYIGGFPEDYEMRVSMLIKLWVAEGFLKPKGCNKSLEATAEEYLEDLVKRHLVVVTERKSNGKIRSVSMHDLMREMCIRKSQQENFFLRGLLRQGVKIPRHVSISYPDQLGFLKKVYGSTIRTIIGLGHRRHGRRGSLGHFRLLRTLDLSLAPSIRSIPDEVFELFQLRYLAFYYPCAIPRAVANLQNLQSFIIYLRKEWKYLDYYARRPIFVPLPPEIWRMRQLRHLVFCFHLPLCQEGSAAFALENLHTLYLAKNFVCTPNIMRMIPNLKKMGISFMGREHDEEIHEEDYQLQNLIYLQQLEKLKLKICPGFPCSEKVNPAFPMSLIKLTLSGWGLLSWKV